MPREPSFAPVRSAGAVMAIGGALREDHEAVWTRLLQEAGGPGARIAVFATASERPIQAAARTVRLLRRWGARAEAIPIAPCWRGLDWRVAREDPHLAARVAAMDAAYFCGGAQALITEALPPEGPPCKLLQALRALLARGGLLAGTSAGAAVLSDWMFRDALDTLAVLRGRLREGREIGRGLGFVGPQLLIDQHFLQRGRIGRLLPLMAAKGYRWGLGVEEDSAALIRAGAIEVIGARGALLVDLQGAHQDPALHDFNLRGAALSLLADGDRHHLPETLSRPAAARKRHQVPARQGGSSHWPDMLAPQAIAHAMLHLLGGPADELRGHAGRGRGRGFEFRLYKGVDTRGFADCAWGGPGAHSVQRVYLDVQPLPPRAPASALP